MKLKCNMEGWWEYLPLESAVAAAGTEEVKTYAISRQNNISQYIVTRPIL